MGSSRVPGPTGSMYSVTDEGDRRAGGSSRAQAKTPGPSGRAASAMLEESFADVSQELGLELPGTTVPSRHRNMYPDFEAVPQGLLYVAQQQIQSLEQQVGIPIPRDRVVSASWVGRIRDRAGELTSTGTSQGWLRNESRFWSAFRKNFPDDYRLLGPNRTVTPEIAQRYKWPDSLVGDKLIHHHIENGPFVVAIPESLHQQLSRHIHARPTVVGSH